MKGVGAAGIAGIAGGSGTALAAADNDANNVSDGDDAFAALRVGNLVPDVAISGPGRGPPEGTPGRRGSQAPDSTALDVYVGKPPDGNPTIGNVYYRSFGPGPADAYLQIPASDYDVVVTRSGDTEPLIEESFTVDAGYRYSALAVGRSSPEDDEPELQPVVLEDATSTEEATPPEDMAEASFVHASPNAGPVDISVDGASVLEDVEFGDTSHYQSVPPGEREVEVQADGETVLSLTRELVANTRITLYVVGQTGVDEFPTDQGIFGLSTVATVDGLNPLPQNVLIR